MNIFECLLNTTLCFELYIFNSCLPESDRCWQFNENCLIDKIDERLCVCSHCFTGDYCEKEASRNLWESRLLFIDPIDNFDLISNFIHYGFSILGLFNSILCLQTYLCKKIRQTNLGVYLIMLSITSMLFGISSLIVLSIYLHSKESVNAFLYTDIFCINYKRIYRSVFFMFDWFIAAVAIERMLVECYINYSLHDSRRRSIKFSLFILIICPLSTLIDVFTLRDKSSHIPALIRCENFTEFGYILHQIIKYIHYFAFYFVYITMNIIVLIKLIRRRQRFVENDSIIDQIRLILRKHKDFFIPYLVQALARLPRIILDFIMTCATANTFTLVYVDTIASTIELMAYSITFYLYICLSPVYLSIFWDNSPFGKCLIKMKHKLTITYQSRVNNNSILLETFT